MPYTRIVHIWEPIWELEEKLSMVNVYNVPSMDGYMMDKLGFVQVHIKLLADYDDKPMKVLNIEYNDDMGSKECKKV